MHAATPAEAAFFGLFGNTEQARAEEGAHSYLYDSSNLLVAVQNHNLEAGRGGPEVLIDNDALSPAISSEGVVFSESHATSDQISIYTVREGDNLSSIAKMFGVSVNTIRWSNDLPSNGVIRIGQKLTILPVDGIKYVVKKGDTLASIAKKFKGDVTEIENYNILAEGEALTPGDSIVIPGGVAPVVVSAPAKGSSSAGLSPVRPGYSGPEILGYFIRPVQGIKTQGIHGKNAVDIGVPVGTPVHAAAAGEVIVARDSGYNGGYGEMVVITHPNGTQTVYGHLSQVNVASGQQVSQGDVIALSGNTGNSTGPHLHIEVRGAKNPF